MKKSLYFLLLLIIINNSLIKCYFQISLFKKLNQKNENLVLSPLSIFLAISLVTNGAKGDTQTELLNLLDKLGMEEINELNLKILTQMKEISSVEIANAIMTKLSPLSKFSKIAKNNYFSEILPLKSVKQINDWCDKKTHGKIKEIIDKLEDNIFMVILNAIYFKGEWMDQFKKELTSKKPFYNYNSEKDGKNVDMMTITKHYRYFQDSNLQAINLPYKKDSISALIILPNKSLNINEFIDILNEDNEYLYTIINNLKYLKVNLQMPKFEITYNKSLKEVLKSMGANLAFEPKADFSNIRSQNDLMIDKIIHKTYLKVNEEGTEAAAVTMIGMMLTSMAPIPEKIYYMNIDRPFLFILRNDQLPKNHDIIFISKIEKII